MDRRGAAARRDAGPALADADEPARATRRTHRETRRRGSPLDVPAFLRRQLTSWAGPCSLDGPPRLVDLHGRVRAPVSRRLAFPDAADALDSTALATSGSGPHRARARWQVHCRKAQWQQRERRGTPREGGRLRAQAARRAAARRARVPEHLLRRDVQPRLPDRSTRCSTSRTTSSASGCSCRRRGAGGAARGGRDARHARVADAGARVRRACVLACRSSGTTRTSSRCCGWPACRCGPRRATLDDPLVVIGGAVTFVNPEPLALFADVIAAGEGEALVPPLVRAFQAADGPRRPAARARRRARLLRAVVLRRALRRRRHDRRRSRRRRAPARRRW